VEGQLTASPEPPRSRSPAGAVEHDAQVRLLQLVRWIDALGEELAAVQGSLPEPPPEKADAMEEGVAPESLAHYLRTAIECTRRDWLPTARATLEMAAEMSQGALDADWYHRARVGAR
jgi:hypothetical protein